MRWLVLGLGVLFHFLLRATKNAEVKTISGRTIQVETSGIEGFGASELGGAKCLASGLRWVRLNLGTIDWLKFARLLQECGQVAW